MCHLLFEQNGEKKATKTTRIANSNKTLANAVVSENDKRATCTGTKKNGICVTLYFANQIRSALNFGAVAHFDKVLHPLKCEQNAVKLHI